MKIAVYTDQPVLVAGLRSTLLLEYQCDLQKVYTTLSEVMGLAGLSREEQPDVLLMDMTPEITFAALSELRRSTANTKIVLLARSISTEFAFQAMGLGVRGILRSTLPLEFVGKCLQQVHAGELWFEKALTDRFLSANRIALKQREGQLVNLLCQGLKNKEIATALMIGEGTVKIYLHRLFKKLGVKDRFELALWGLTNMVAVQPQKDDPQYRAQDCPSTPGMPLPGLRSIVIPREPEQIPFEQRSGRLVPASRPRAPRQPSVPPAA
jgi:DNA-binding NarL/FixJ family response regulator